MKLYSNHSSREHGSREHGSRVMFRTDPAHAYEPGTWDSIVQPPRIRDVFGYWVESAAIRYVGQLCIPADHNTCAGVSAFDMF